MWVRFPGCYLLLNCRFKCFRQGDVIWFIKYWCLHDVLIVARNVVGQATVARHAVHYRPLLIQVCATCDLKWVKSLSIPSWRKYVLTITKNGVGFSKELDQHFVVDVRLFTSNVPIMFFICRIFCMYNSWVSWEHFVLSDQYVFTFSCFFKTLLL